MLDDPTSVADAEELPAPAEPSRRRAVVLIALGVVAVAALVIGVLALRGTDDDGGSESDEESPARALEPDDLGAPPNADEMQHFRDLDGQFSMRLPAEWRVVELSDTSRPVPEQVSASPSIRHFVEETYEALPQSGALIAFDEDSLSSKFLTNMNVLSTPIDERTTLDDLEETAGSGIAEFGGEFQSVARVSTQSGEALRLRYRSPNGFEGLQYQVLAGDTQWLITISAKDVDAGFEVFDASARSFQLIR